VTGRNSKLGILAILAVIFVGFGVQAQAKRKPQKRKAQTTTIVAPKPTTAPAKSKLAMRIVFFTPKDVDPPEGTGERMKQIADYTQAFFSTWMKHWGYPPAQPLAIPRDKDGVPKILFFKGEHTQASGKYSKLGFQRQVAQQALEKYGIPNRGQVWWMFMHKAVETNWGRGGGDVRRGGGSTARYYTDAGQIKATDQLGGGFLKQICLKGAVHEFGHALGLPHIGPKDRDKLGNSLMGPVNKAYAARKDDKEQRVYLSHAAAAMLWKHPLFTGTTKDRNLVPTVKLLDFKAPFDRKAHRFNITGKLKSDYGAHSVIVADVPKRSHPGGYWQKMFVGRIAKDGTFSVSINELRATDGELRIFFCFNNGAIGGAGFRPGRGGEFVKPYRCRNGVLELDTKTP
jgi:hypothetical protein